MAEVEASPLGEGGITVLMVESGFEFGSIDIDTVILENPVGGVKDHHL